MSNVHPTTPLLLQFCQGELDDVLSVMISAHLNSCETCRLHVESMQSALATEALSPSTSMSQERPFQEDTPSLSPQEIDAMLATLPDLSELPEPSQEPPQSQIRFHGRDIQVPPMVAPLIKQAGPWTHVVNKLWRSSITGHGLPYQLDFIYMEAGASIPSHTHKGNELTLVLEGSVSDEEGHYGPGAMLTRTRDHQHSPYSESGCLCLAAIDAPLIFVSGFARLLNPFSSLFFKTESH